MKTFDFEQYSELWWAIRRGVPTASEFDSIITPAKGELSKSAINYIYRLIGDRYSLDYPNTDGFVSKAMQKGTDTEPKARRWYEFETGNDVKQVGFCMTDDGNLGCSPDALVGDDGVLELKCPEPQTQVAYLMDGGLPAKYKPQCHGHLVVTGRSYCDFMSYAEGLPPLLVRVEPDDFTEKLRAALDEFCDRYAAILQQFEKQTGAVASAAA